MADDRDRERDDGEGERSKADEAIQAIFDIIDRYYKGLKREKEGMGVD